MKKINRTGLSAVDNRLHTRIGKYQQAAKTNTTCTIISVIMY